MSAINFPLFGLILLLAATSQAVIVVQDTFDVGSPPGRGNDAADSLDLPYFSRQSTTTFSLVPDNFTGATNNALRVNNSINFLQIVGTLYGGGFGPIALTNVGDYVTLSFNFRRVGAPSNLGTGTKSMRFGLYDSNGTLTGADNDISSDDDFGYFSSIDLTLTNNPSVTREAGTNGHILSGGDTAALTTGANPATLNDTNAHLIIFVVYRSATNTISLYTGLDGILVAAGAHTSAAIFTTFDEIAFGTGDLTASYQIDNVTVEWVPMPLVSIGTQPQSQTVAPGANVLFTVVASGVAPPAYQWQFNGTNLAGATNDSLTLTNAQLTNAGSYTVVCTNVYGATNSVPAILTVSSNLPSLRQAATARGFLWGAAVQTSYLNDTNYVATLKREFSQIEPEFELKWATLHPGSNSYNFTAGDALAAFALSNQMQMRGHTLVWHANNPAWLTNGNYTTNQLSQILQDHITAVVSHFAGKVYAWDVVNEALNSDGSIRSSIWSDSPGIGLGGTSYIEQSFRWAHAADTNALLFYNDYSAEDISTKSTAIYNMVADFKARGVPIHGVGLQMHKPLSSGVSLSGLEANLKRLTDLGVQVHLTEMDVALAVTNAVPAPPDLSAQAKFYQDVLASALKSTPVTSAQIWGFTDLHSSVTNSSPGSGAALIFDAAYRAKPAYWSLLALFRVPNPPVLNVAGSGTNAVLSWPVLTAGFGLEARDDLSGAPVWTNAVATINVIGETNTVTVPISGTQRFFRLRRP